jgi:predicted nucleic acid-binding protein
VSHALLPNSLPFFVASYERDHKEKALVQPNDTYDLFIAATAMYHNLTLITRNIQDYEQIPD